MIFNSFIRAGLVMIDSYKYAFDENMIIGYSI